jgi:hypothetical protein
MNTWNTLPESYQQRVYNNTLATVKCQIHQAEDPTPAVVISMEAAHVDNAILLDHLASKMALDEPEIGITDLNIPIDKIAPMTNFISGCHGAAGITKMKGDESDDCEAIPTASRRQRPLMELEKFDLGTSDVDGYEGDDGNDADADEEEEASQAVDGSTQNEED